MFLDGHREILAELIENRLRPDFFSGWSDSSDRTDSTMILKAINRGLAYPDLPCGKVKLVKQQDLYVAVLHRPLLCSVLSLYQLMFPRNHQYSELFQSHLGALAHVHSMAPGYKATSLEVVKEIVSHSISIAMLFWKCFEKNAEKPLDLSAKNGAFWLGILIHTLTDSYSESHTIRVPEVGLIASQTPDEELSRVMRHSAVLYDLAGKTLDKPLTSKGLAREIEKIRRIKKRGIMHKAQQHQTYMLFLMYRSIDRDVRGILPNIDRSIASFYNKTSTLKNRDSTYDIRAFSFYPTQKPHYHALRDRVFLVKDRPELFKRMLDDCERIVNIFKQGAISADRGDGDVGLKRFISKVLECLMNGPYRLAPGAAGMPPMNYDDGWKGLLK